VKPGFATNEPGKNFPPLGRNQPDRQHDAAAGLFIELNYHEK
jgi:hypothetical protein